MRFLVGAFAVLALSTLSTATTTFIDADIGRPLTLDMGDDVTVWARKLTGGRKTEYISKCSVANSTNQTNCDQWTVNGVKTGNRAMVADDGKLHIEKLTKEDEGIYFAPEKKPRIYNTKTGYYAVSPNVFHVLPRSTPHA